MTYEAFRDRVFQERGRGCQVGPRLPGSVFVSICHGFSGGLHHLRKRSAGGPLMDEANVLVCCDPCNLWIEDNPAEARRLGLSRGRGKA